jgi:hypothetical protein
MLTRRAVVLALVVEGFVYLGMGIVVADVRAHKHVEEEHGVNARGFRGTLTIHKTPAERRVAIVGGTAAYGYAVDWGTSLGPALQNRLEQGWRRKHRVGEVITVINLAEPGAGAASYAGTLRHYSYLAPDVVCIYDGYAAPESTAPLGRDRSFVFRKAGYLPILDDLLRERASWSVPPAGVDPELQDRNDAVNDAAHNPSCEGPSAAYCAAMEETVSWGLTQGMSVVVAVPPYVSARHRLQQESLAAALARRFGSSPRFQYVAVDGSVDLANRGLTSDGVNLNASGYEAVADRIVDPIFDAVHQMTSAR